MKPSGASSSDVDVHHICTGPQWATRDELSIRLQFVSLIYGLGFLAVFLIRILTTPEFNQRETFTIEAAAVGTSALVAGLVFVFARWQDTTDSQLVNLGLSFEIIAAFGIAFTEQWGIFGGGPAKLYGISWICVWVLIFALVLPCTPLKTLFASLASASMLVLAHLFSVAFDQSPRLSASILFDMFFPAYVAALIAFFAARILHRLRSDLRRAQRMGCYELVELIGQGGMGEVWRARHSLLTRPAAIKLIRLRDVESSDGQNHQAALERFRFEAQSTAAMRSSNTIQLYDFGITQDGTFYYVMELLDGMDLLTLVRKYGPIQANRAVYLLRQICHSLGEAHASGLIHRDIKPTNIFICRFGRDVDFVKVLDFGIAKQQKATSGSDLLTRTGTLCGTPEFMSPEQILGDRPIDKRVDVYALGGVAYWLVTGHLVFTGSSPAQVMAHHLKTAPIAPSRLSELPIPPELDDLILSCLSKDPDLRPQNVDDLAVDLAATVSGNAWTTEQAHEWWDLHLPAATPGEKSP
jgi:serine/threonine-protein kinase